MCSVSKVRLKYVCLKVKAQHHRRELSCLTPKLETADANKIKLSGDLGADAKVGVSYGSAAGDAFGVVEDGDPGRGFVCDQDAKLYGAAGGDGKLCWTSGKHGLVIFFDFK